MSDPTPAAWLKAQRPLAGRPLALAIGAQLVHGALVIAQAWLLALILNGVVFGGAGLAEVRPWLLGLLALFAARALAVWTAERAAARAAARIGLAVRDRLYRHLRTLGPAWLAGEESGALIETLTRAVDDLDGYYARWLPAAALAAALPLGILLLVLPLDWLSALALTFTAPMIPLFMVLIGRGAEDLNRRQWRELTRLGARFLDAIQGLGTLKVFDAGDREAEALARSSEAYREGTMRVLRVAFLSSAVLEFFATVGIALVAVFIGFRLYRMELPVPDWIGVPEIGYLHGLFILLLAPELYLPLRNLGTQYHARMEATAAAERIVALLGTPPPGAATAPARPPSAQLGPRDTPIEIACESLGFAYAPGREALTGLSLAVRPGERIALVGPSGAGKSTLVALLLGFLRPDLGRIRVNGVDLAALDLADWRARLAWVPQTPRLFAGTLIENVRLGLPPGDPRGAPAAVELAARRAGALDFVAALPDGWETRVGERGLGLSGGQIQRIALARAFLRDAPLAILDEPTANLDRESEERVQAGIAELARGRTLIAIAHRLATVEAADRILVLDRGRLAETGTHAELMARGGLYRRLVEATGDGLTLGDRPAARGGAT